MHTAYIFIPPGAFDLFESDLSFDFSILLNVFDVYDCTTVRQSKRKFLYKNCSFIWRIIPPDTNFNLF